MRTRLTIGLLLAVLAFYLVTIGWRRVVAISTGEPAAVALGLSLLVVPGVGAWAIWRELSFGASTQRLAAELQATGRWPTEELPARPSGRPDRAAADAVFEQRRVEVATAPDDWAAWFRLGLAYDDAGDRRRAREALQRAIALHDRSS